MATQGASGTTGILRCSRPLNPSRLGGTSSASPRSSPSTLDPALTDNGLLTNLARRSMRRRPKNPAYFQQINVKQGIFYTPGGRGGPGGSPKNQTISNYIKLYQSIFAGGRGFCRPRAFLLPSNNEQRITLAPHGGAKAAKKPKIKLDQTKSRFFFYLRPEAAPGGHPLEQALFTPRFAVSRRTAGSASKSHEDGWASDC